MIGMEVFSIALNPTGPQDGTFKVLRGGSWNDTSNISSAYRYKTDQNVSDNHRIGFRLPCRI